MKARIAAAVALALALALGAFLPKEIAGPPAPHALGGVTLIAKPSDPGKPGLQDSKAGLPIIASSSPLAPGHSVSGSLTITAAGSAPESVTVWQDHLKTSPANGPDLASFATLTVQDTSTSQTVYSGTVESFNGASNPLTLCGSNTSKSGCPAWAGGEAHLLVFTVSLPNVPSENTYEGTSLTTDVEWSSTVGGPNP